jgi:hypothetical protein
MQWPHPAEAGRLLRLLLLRDRALSPFSGVRERSMLWLSEANR